MALIHEAIVKVMHDCGAVGKDAFNPQQKYKYRGIDAVMNALNPAMKKNGIFVAPQVMELNREERESRTGGTLVYSVAKVKYTFFATDGSSVDVIVCGEGMDSGDKSMNKAMSAAFKYALFQVFCIPTEEMVDSEIDSPEVKPKKATRTANKSPKEAPKDEVDPGELAERLQNAGVSIEYVVGAYKVKSFSELTKEQLKWCEQNINTLKKATDRWKAKQG